MLPRLQPFLLLALCVSSPPLFAQEDWTQYRCTVRFAGETTRRPLTIERKQHTGYQVRFPLPDGTSLELTLTRSGKTYRGRSAAGIAGALDAGKTSWRVSIVGRRGLLARHRAGTVTRTRFELRLQPKPKPPAPVTPKQLSLEASGPRERELRAHLKRRRSDELTVVFWNLGKGQHTRALQPVKARGVELDPLNANLRVLARLRPDFLVLAEVSRGTPATIDPGTEAALGKAFPHRFSTPSIKEYPRTNNNVVYSRFALKTETKWLDWTPTGASDVERARFKRAWGGDTYNTRAHTRIEFTLGGKPCVLFPVHFAMPWLQVAPTAKRGGFLVDGIQHSQLHVKGPLYHQIQRARAEYAEVAHGRVVIVGDANISEFPRAMFPPLRVDPTATGDGQPARKRALAFELLAEGYFNAFQGDRTTWSYPAASSSDPRTRLLPKQLIDQCLHGGQLEVRYRTVFFPRGSDHGALLVRLRLRKSARTPPRPFRPKRRLPAPGADADPPRIEVRAPARGAFVGASRVDVVGTVRDGGAVDSLRINGAAVALGTDGAFRHTVSLSPGLNLLELVARDAEGNLTRSWRSVRAGRLRREAPLSKGLAVRLNLPAFATAERLAGDALARADLGQELIKRNPLLDRRYGGDWVHAQVRVEAVRARMGRAAVRIQPRPDGSLRVAVTIPAVTVDLKVRCDPSLLPAFTIHPRLTVRSARVEARARARVAGGLVPVRTSLEGTRATLTGFHLHLGGVPEFAERWVSQRVRAVVEHALRSRVEATVPTALNLALAVGARPFTRTILGRAVTLELAPEQISFDAHGATFRVGAQVGVSGPGPKPSGAQRGSLSTNGSHPAASGLDRARGAAVAIDDDLLNRVGHAAWAGGALHATLRPESAARLGLPAWTRNMKAGLLANVFPALIGDDREAPLEVTLAPLAPPVFQRGAQGGLQLGLGDLLVSLYAAPAGGSRRLLCKVAAQVLASWTIGVGSDGALQVAASGTPTVHADVFGSPIAGSKQLAVEALLEQLLPPVLEKLRGLVSGAQVLPSALRPLSVAVSVR